MSFECTAWGAPDAAKSSVVEKMTIKRRALGPNDVHIKILNSSICHSDCHHIRGEWGPLKGQQVVGHEMTGIIQAVGEKVDPARVGTWAGVGCMVGAKCLDKTTGKLTCNSCVNNKDERFCEKGQIGTYGSVEIMADGTEQATMGGYSTDIVVDANFAVEIPEFFQQPENQRFGPPIMCAGTTLYTALVHGGCGPQKRVGINGIGGLGYFGISIALAMGAEVYAFTRSESKKADLLALGVKDVIITTDEEQVKAYANKLDLIVDTVSAVHNIDQMLSLLAPFGKLGCVGAPPTMSFMPFSMIIKQLSVYGSIIGSIQHSREVLELCAKHKICIPVEMINPKDIEASYGRMLKSDVKYRFAIDMDAMRNDTQ